MIKSITGGAGINVIGNSYSMPFINMGAPSAGMVRYNGNSQTFEVYDGNVWMSVTSSLPQIELNGETQAIMEWARTKMAEELRLKQLAITSPALKDAIEALKRAEEKVNIIAALVE